MDRQHPTGVGEPQRPDPGSGRAGRGDAGQAGEVQSAQVGRVAEDLRPRRTQKNREIMSRLVQREVKRQLGVLGMATRDALPWSSSGSAPSSRSSNGPPRPPRRVPPSPSPPGRPPPRRPPPGPPGPPRPRRPRPRRPRPRRPRPRRPVGTRKSSAAKSARGQALDPDPHRRGELALHRLLTRHPPQERRRAPRWGGVAEPTPGWAPSSATRRWAPPPHPPVGGPHPPPRRPRAALTPTRRWMGPLPGG